METNEDNKKVWREIIVKSITIFKVNLKNLQVFIKKNDKDRKNIVLFLLSRRIITNIRAIAELAGVSYKNNGTLLFKLPVGLLLRNCLTDSITGLYLIKQDNVTFEHIMEKLNHDYARALFEELEVYRDKLNTYFDDGVLEQIYTSFISDTFYQYLDINEKQKEEGTLYERSVWNVESQEEYMPKGINGNTQMANMARTLSKDKQFGDCAKSLYAYYKYYSQWEHFSENGIGDILANFGEDNIKMSMTFGHINTALDFMLNNTNKG